MRVTREVLDKFFNKYLSKEYNDALYFDDSQDEDGWRNVTIFIGLLNGCDINYTEAEKTIKNLILSFDNVLFVERNDIENV